MSDTLLEDIASSGRDSRAEFGGENNFRSRVLTDIESRCNVITLEANDRQGKTPVATQEETIRNLRCRPRR